MRSRLVALNDKLTRRATLAQQRVEQIETMRATWVATQASARETMAPSTVLQQIDATIAAIAAARKNAADGLAHVLALQDRTVKEAAAPAAIPQTFTFCELVVHLQRSGTEACVMD